MRLPLLLAGITGLVIANPLKLSADFNRYAPRQPGINWEECPHPIDKSLRCGRFEVPMDYRNISAGKASLAVIKYPATKQPRLGTLFLNPGGPGASGIEFVSGGFRTTVSNAAGGQYDLVSWDPRGVGATYPRIDCFDDAQQENDFWEGTIPRAGLEARGNFTERDDRDAFYKQSSEVDRLLHALGGRCLTYNGDTLKYVGTAATVRDMIGLHEYLEQKKGPINFWGFSYGTMVGSFFVNMFPDRVGRVVLDGVVDPEYYASRPPYKRWAIQASSSDDAFEGFVKTCSAAGPAKCAFARDGSSPFSLKERVRALLDSGYDYKKKTGSWPGSSFLRNKIFHAMYGPSSWPRLARELNACESFFKTRNDNDQSQCIKWQPPKAMLKGNPPPDYSLQAISCGDAVDMPGVDTGMVFDELVKVTNQVSHMFGPSWGSAGFYCHQWPARAAERYSGPWNSTLSNKILVIGNEADPVTPLKSAKNVAAALKDSAVLVEQDDWGHTSLAMHSDCTIDVLKNYFVNNAKPTSGKICGTDRKIFGDMTRSMLLSAYQDPSPGDISSKVEKSSPTPQTFFNWPSSAMISLACAGGFFLASLVQAAKRRWGNSARGVSSEAKFLDTKKAGLS